MGGHGPSGAAAVRDCAGGINITKALIFEKRYNDPAVFCGDKAGQRRDMGGHGPSGAAAVRDCAGGINITKALIFEKRECAVLNRRWCYVMIKRANGWRRGK